MIRENTRSLRRAAEREIARDLNELSWYFIELPDLTQLYFKSLELPQELNFVERFRLERLFSYIFSAFQSALEYHKDGHLSEAAIEKNRFMASGCCSNSLCLLIGGNKGRFTFGQELCDTVLQGETM